MTSWLQLKYTEMNKTFNSQDDIFLLVSGEEISIFPRHFMTWYQVFLILFVQSSMDYHVKC